MNAVLPPDPHAPRIRKLLTPYPWIRDVSDQITDLDAQLAAFRARRQEDLAAAAQRDTKRAFFAGMSLMRGDLVNCSACGGLHRPGACWLDEPAERPGFLSCEIGG